MNAYPQAKMFLGSQMGEAVPVSFRKSEGEKSDKRLRGAWCASAHCRPVGYFHKYGTLVFVGDERIKECPKCASKNIVFDKIPRHQAKSLKEGIQP